MEKLNDMENVAFQLAVLKQFQVQNQMLTMIFSCVDKWLPYARFTLNKTLELSDNIIKIEKITTSIIGMLEAKYDALQQEQKGKPS